MGLAFQLAPWALGMQDGFEVGVDVSDGMTLLRLLFFVIVAGVSIFGGRKEALQDE